MTTNQLKTSTEYYIHHTASRRGYISWKSEGEVREYKGKFGEGYTLETPRFDTTQYTYITYYIKNN